MSAYGRVCALVLAGGVGSRMGGELTKQKINILGRSVLYYSVAAFEACPDVDDIVVVAREDEISFALSELKGMSKVRDVVRGGLCRAESAELGFIALPDSAKYVAIHDAARPLITPENISAVVTEAARLGAASAVSCITDTVKVVDDEGVIVSTLDRGMLRRAETPQVFSTDLYKKALDVIDSFIGITDDNMLLERIGVRVGTVDVGRENIKITVPEDLKYAELLLKERGWQDV